MGPGCPVFFGGGGGWGAGQNFFVVDVVCGFGTWVSKYFFLVYGPPTLRRGPGSELQVGLVALYRGGGVKIKNFFYGLFCLLK